MNAISDHSHYPVTNDDRAELYDDLRTFGGLTHDQAVETVGYAVAREAWGCEQTGPLAAFLIASEYAPFESFDASAFEQGATIGAQEATRNFLNAL